MATTLPTWTPERPDNGKGANGAILWRGESSVDGAPVVVVAIGLASGSTNTKTGNMLQTYIIRSDVAPIEAVRDGRDVSICGGCKHRPSTGGACYVVVAQGPQAVWKGLNRGIYPDLSGDPEAIRAAGRGRMVRLGTYGDPVAAPVDLWQALTADAVGHTGYTHQWRRDVAAPFRALLQASVDNVAELEAARGAEWGTFRVRSAEAPVEPGEFICPASEEAGKVTTCRECKACDGASGAAVVIISHGTKKARAKVD